MRSAGRPPLVGTNESYYAAKIGEPGDDAPDDALLMYHSSIPRQRGAAS